MNANKFSAGDRFPSLHAVNAEGAMHDLSKRADADTWRMVVVFRGRHCPLCTKYLNELEAHIAALRDLKIDVVAVSGDSAEQMREHLSRLQISYPIYQGLTIEQMRSLGLYISSPRSEQETDHPFCEPGLFIINAQDKVQVLDISNSPFTRPDLAKLVSGLAFVKKPGNDYPIRGTY